MELPEVRNPNSVRDLLADLGHIYTNNVKLSRDIIYSSVLREKVHKVTEFLRITVLIVSWPGFV